MATGTSYNPLKLIDLDPANVSADAQSVSAVCGANTTTNLDLTLTDDEIFTGAIFIVGGASYGDYFAMQILNGATVIATPVQRWYLPTTGVLDLGTAVPKKLIAGLTLRIAVTTTVVLVTPFFAVNYKIGKALA